jgi:predicted enzyme related to lactoylglutathione lyase
MQPYLICNVNWQADHKMEMDMKIALTSIFVNNPLEAFKFYTQVLGFVERLYLPEAYLAIVASPEDPEGTGLLLEPNDNPIAKTFQKALYEQGLPPMVFGVADVQEEYERLKKLGVVFLKEPVRTEWGIQAVLDDTCGNYIQIQQV